MSYILLLNLVDIVGEIGGGFLDFQMRPILRHGLRMVLV